MSSSPPSTNTLQLRPSLALSDDSIATLATTPSLHTLHGTPTANTPPVETYERARRLYTHLLHARADAQKLPVVHWRLTPTALIAMVVGDSPDEPVQEIALETDELVWRRDAPYGIEFAVPVANTDSDIGNSSSAAATTAGTPTSSTGTIAAESNDEYHGAVPVFVVYSEDTRENELWFALLQSHRATRPLRPATAILTATSLQFSVPPYEDHAIVRLYDALADASAPPLPPTNSMSADVGYPIADPATRATSTASCDFLGVCGSLELVPAIIASRRASLSSTDAITSRRASIASTDAITSRRASLASTDTIASRRASIASTDAITSRRASLTSTDAITSRRASIASTAAITSRRASAAVASTLPVLDAATTTARRASIGAVCLPAARAAAASRRASTQDDAARGSCGMLNVRDSLEMVAVHALRTSAGSVAAAAALQAAALDVENGAGARNEELDAPMEVDSVAEPAANVVGESVDSVIAPVPAATSGIPETAAADLDATFVSPAVLAAPKVLDVSPHAVAGEMPAHMVV
ncbi:hypothetical protein AMAG_11259 [Allomyces macrogynus ATCC 38327]|uniref:Uncharacterized protein n=1 Tax=Allomyces macrogynus (strain ATCC 38327) TaxID=578462 RepID=A0A0L0SWJ8_ALLM3|nr:hypothetical protein AMAG_11259 [Allomyces macrogynus ATCC 38327]|eukprot:KNE66765.1 hypothetical protein AMAG_11259 [Allomyces macrogynus ATCC 38327]